MSAPRLREAGFSVVELMVVLLVLAVLLGIGFYSIGTARSSGRHIGTVAAAQAYADAADRFAREHRGRYPLGPGRSGPAGVDWEGGAAAARGPKSDVLGQVKYYLREVPEGVQDGSIAIGSAGPARFAYEASNGGTGYVITVTVQGSEPCVITGGSATDARRPCARR